MISVCMATYNGEKYIREQIMSILTQLDEEDEIIISDDNSDDDTVHIIKSLNDFRIRIVNNERKTRKHPAISNFENALINSKGDFIFLSDQDDVWMENKIETTMKYLRKYDVVVSDCLMIDESNRIMKESFFEYNNSVSGFINNLKKNSYIGCCMAFRRNILIKVLPFPKDIPLHDLWIGFVAEVFYKPVFINEKLILYRRHNNVSSFTGGKSKYSFLKKISFRINCIKYLPKIIFR